MDDRRGPSVQEVQPLQDLPAPTPQHFDLHHLEPFQISGGDDNKTIEV